MNCTRCQFQLNPCDNYCMNCGQKVEQTINPQTQLQPSINDVKLNVVSNPNRQYIQPKDVNVIRPVIKQL